MKISIDWLRDFVDFDLTPEELADTLTALGLEATVDSRAYDFDGVVVGKVVKVDPLPGSDHLTICQVDVGGSELLTIVCGAPNVTPEVLVPVAKIGARLPGNHKVKKAKVRGEVSQGMICAEDELGLSDDHSGIIILKSDAPLGQDFKEYLMSTQHATLDLDLTPNRGDAFSHLGVARDLAARFNATLRIPKISYKEGTKPVGDLARIDISAPQGCHRYASRVICGVNIGPSPEWMVKRLESVGLRSINNVVDASNYVLMELGHPLHVFDYDRLAGHRIDVYFAKPGQTFISLDGQERRLDERHLLIADGEGPVALAGIMGGLNSEVTESTTNILIESAYFEPSAIRRGSKSLELSTEASKRFERDTDIEGLILALERVTALIVEVAGGTVAKGRIDIYPRKHTPREIDLSVTFTNRLLGTSLDAEDMASFLGRLGIAVARKGKDILRCVVPLSRPELTQPVDLIEEIARLFGYDQIPAIESVEVKLQSLISDSQAFFSSVRSSLVPWGFHEHMANTLTRGDYAGIFSDAEAIEIRNPLSIEMAFLRTSLIPGLIQAVAFNERRQQRAVQLFEIGTVHWIDTDAYNRAGETFLLGLITTLGSGSGEVHWKKPAPKDIYFLKGTINQLLRTLNIPSVGFTPTESKGLTSALNIRSGDMIIGRMGEISAQLREVFSLESPVAVAELNLAQLEQIRQGAGIHYHDVVPYPFMERDMSLEVPQEFLTADLIATINQEGGKYFRDLSIFDVYSGKGIQQGKRSIGFRLYFQSRERTLTDEEVDQQVQRIAEALSRRHQVVWRQS